jgi:hypothetical protein
MSDIQFDPFGERVDAALKAAETDRVSRGLSRAGMGLFWLLVVVIVSARVAFFDPDFAEKSTHFAAWISSLWNVAGA